MHLEYERTRSDGDKFDIFGTHILVSFTFTITRRKTMFTVYFSVAQF